MKLFSKREKKIFEEFKNYFWGYLFNISSHFSTKANQDKMMFHHIFNFWKYDDLKWKEQKMKAFLNQL